MIMSTGSFIVLDSFCDSFWAHSWSSKKSVILARYTAMSMSWTALFSRKPPNIVANTMFSSVLSTRLIFSTIFFFSSGGM